MQLVQSRRLDMKQNTEIKFLMEATCAKSQHRMISFTINIKRRPQPPATKQVKTSAISDSL